MVLGILYNFICEEGAIPRRSASSVGDFLAEKIFFRFLEQNSETEAFLLRRYRISCGQSFHCNNNVFP